MEEMMKILEGIRPDVDFPNETKLIDLEPDNFNTVKAMWELIQSYQE